MFLKCKTCCHPIVPAYDFGKVKPKDWHDESDILKIVDSVKQNLTETAVIIIMWQLFILLENINSFIKDIDNVL